MRIAGENTSNSWEFVQHPLKGGLLHQAEHRRWARTTGAMQVVCPLHRHWGGKAMPTSDRPVYQRQPARKSVDQAVSPLIAGMYVHVYTKLLLLWSKYCQHHENRIYVCSMGGCHRSYICARSESRSNAQRGSRSGGGASTFNVYSHLGQGAVEDPYSKDGPMIVAPRNFYGATDPINHSHR